MEEDLGDEEEAVMYRKVEETEKEVHIGDSMVKEEEAVDVEGYVGTSSVLNQAFWEERKKAVKINTFLKGDISKSV